VEGWHTLKAEAFETNRFHWSSLSATPNKKELQVLIKFLLEAA